MTTSPFIETFGRCGRSIYLVITDVSVSVMIFIKCVPFMHGSLTSGHKANTCVHTTCVQLRKFTAYDRRKIALYERRYFPRAPNIMLTLTDYLMLIKRLVEEHFYDIETGCLVYEEIYSVRKCL